MEAGELDRVKSIEMLKELQIEHKSIKNNPELLEIQKKVTRFRKREENLRYKGQADSDLVLELRQKFQNALNKLNSIDTRQVALKEAKDLIKSHTSLDGLKVYISSLTELRKSKDASARELEVSIIGYLAEVYKENLIEEGNSLKLLIRLAEHIQSYFKDLNRNVHKAAALALCDLYQYSLPKSNQQIVFGFMYEPLHSILTTGIDVQVQQAAALSIFVWIELLKAENDQGNLVLIYSKVIGLFLKLRAEFADFLNAIGLLSEACGFQLVVEQIEAVLGKILLYLKHPSSNAYPLKTAACQLLMHLGRYLIDSGHKMEPFPCDILTALRELKTEKVPSLQNKAREALKVWEIFRASALEQPIDLSPAPKVMKRIEPENHFRSIRNLVKMQKEKLKVKEEKKTQESIWGLPKISYLKKGTGNYSAVSTHGNVNIPKALEKRPKIVDELRKRQHSPESVKILYKKNNQVLEYERDPSPKLFQVEKSTENFLANRCIGNMNKRILNTSEEVLKSNSDASISESKVTETKYQTLKNTEVLSQKDTETTDYTEKKEIDNELKEKLTVIEEDDTEFQFFVREESKSTEIGKPLNSSSALKSQHLDQSIEEHPKRPLMQSVDEKIDEIQKIPLLQSVDEKIDFTLNPLKKEILENYENLNKSETNFSVPEKFPSAEKPSEKNFQNDEKKGQESEKFPKTKTEKIQKTKNPETKTPQAPENPFKSTNLLESEEQILRPGSISNPSPEPIQKKPRQFDNKVHLIESQNIEIKPPQKRRSIFKNLDIHNQDMLKIPQHHSPSPSPKFNLSLQHELGYAIKGINNKEVQTSLNDTPRFSIDQSEGNSNQISEFFEYFKISLELVQSEFEEKFFIINDELNKIEERVVWADDTCKCLKRLRTVKKEVKKDMKKTKENCTQSDKVERIASEAKVEVKGNVDPLTEKWMNVLREVEKGDINKAYGMVLETGDDLYLLRLMFKSSPCLRNMPVKMSVKVLGKLIGCLQARFIENIGIEWVVAALQDFNIEKIISEESGELLEAMHNVSIKGGDEAEEAKQVLSYLQKKLI